VSHPIVTAKARQLRLALIAGGIVLSPEPGLSFDDLELERQAKWEDLAEAYLTIFAGGIPNA